MSRQAMARWGCLVLLVSAVLYATPRQASAKETLGDTTSLGQAPEDVAFYSAMFNGRKVYDAILASNAVQRVLELPSTQQALEEMVEELDSEGLLELLAQPENQQLAELVKDMGSHEIYLCGDEGLADMLDFYTEAAMETVRVNFQFMMEGQYGMGEVVVLKATLDVLDRNIEDLKLPNVVIGFKLSDQEEAAAAQMDRLEELLLAAIADMPEWDDDLPNLEGRLERVAVGDDEFLTLRLDGSLFPWDDIDRALEEIGSSVEDYADLRESLEDRELLISVGVRDGYALLAIGPDHDFLANLGEGPALWDRDEMQPLREAELAADEVFSVSYLSDSMAARMDSARRTVSTYLDMFEMMAGMGGAGSAVSFMNDVPELREDLMSLLPERRSLMSYSYFTERGLEGYVYDRSLGLPLDGSQTLPILEHGGDPLLMLAGRQPYSTRTYELATKWAGKFYGYYEDQMNAWGDQREADRLEELREVAEPLLEEIDQIVLTLILPSTADGQRALVLDGDASSETWFEYMDPPAQALPMVEVGVVIGLSDANMLVEGCTSGREVLNDLFEEARDASGGEIPEGFFLPSPDATEIEGGTMYSYAWEDFEFHEAIRPNAVVTEEWLILSLSSDHSQRLMAETALPATPPLARRDQPLAGVMYMNISGAVDAIEPWVAYFAAGNDTWGNYDYGPVEWDEDWAEEAVPEAGDDNDPFDEDPFGEEDPFEGEDPFDGDDPFEDRPADQFEEEYGYNEYGGEYYEPRPRREWQPGELEQTTQAILNLIRSVDSFSAAIYPEDEVMVTHFEWHIVDAGAEASTAAEGAEE